MDFDLEAALLDLELFKLKRVGHKNMTSEELWRDWINSNE